MSGVTILPFLVVFLILFTLAFGIIVAVIIAQYLKDRMGNRIRPKTVKVRPKPSIIPTKKTSERYLTTIDDHLNFESPSPFAHNSFHFPPTSSFRRKSVTLESFGDPNVVKRQERKITKSHIHIGEVIKNDTLVSLHQGNFGDRLINVMVLKNTSSILEEERFEVGEQLSSLTPHPRFMRFLGTCFNPGSREIWILSDMGAGATLEEMWENPHVKKVLDLSESAKLQAATDVLEAVYFLHNHKVPFIHGLICSSTVFIDGETHRGKLLAKETLEKQQKFFLKENLKNLQIAPEILLKNQMEKSDEKSDAWSVTATILELILEERTWIVDEFSIPMAQAMELKLEPTILQHLMGANQLLHFLRDALKYEASERLSVIALLRGMQNLLLKIGNGKKTKTESFIFPQRKLPDPDLALPAKTTTIPLDPTIRPLLRQQIEWNIRQESGRVKRAFLLANTSYPGHVTPLNDIKDITTLLKSSNYSMENSYENVDSSSKLECILQDYVECMNKAEENMDILVFYFSGICVSASTQDLVEKKRLGLLLRRPEIVYDLALVMPDKSLFPLMTLQLLLCQLHWGIKRKLIILDSRIATEDDEVGVLDIEWKVPLMSEAALEKLSSIYTIHCRMYEPDVIAMDSHPTRTNGFLTGCLINAVGKIDKSTFHLEALQRLINAEMVLEGKKARAFRGIECQADFAASNQELWAFPFLDS